MFGMISDKIAEDCTHIVFFDCTGISILFTDVLVHQHFYEAMQHGITTGAANNDPSVTPSAPTATPTPASTPTPSSTAEKTDAAASTPTKVTVETPEQKTDLFPIIVCSIAAVAVAAVVIIAIVAKKKKK